MSGCPFLVRMRGILQAARDAAERCETTPLLPGVTQTLCGAGSGLLREIYTLTRDAVGTFELIETEPRPASPADFVCTRGPWLLGVFDWLEGLQREGYGDPPIGGEALYWIEGVVYNESYPGGVAFEGYLYEVTPGWFQTGVELVSDPPLDYLGIMSRDADGHFSRGDDSTVGWRVSVQINDGDPIAEHVYLWADVGAAGPVGDYYEVAGRYDETPDGESWATVTILN